MSIFESLLGKLELLDLETNIQGDIGISDHSLIYVIGKLCIPTGTTNIILSRQFRNFDPNMLREDLALI